MTGHEINGDLASWEDLEDDYDGKALLLGNGLSIHVWSNFGYGSLYEQARRSQRGGLSDADMKIFRAHNTENFERALAMLNGAIITAEALGRNPAPYYRRYESIKSALGRAVKSVHLELSEVPEDARRIIKEVMLEHKVVFTTNYDLLIYWAMGWEEHYESLVDCFWNKGCRFDATNADVWSGSIPVYFLHGALHLAVLSGGVTRKIVRTDMLNVLDQFGEPVDGDAHARPLIVSEGSAADKRRAIDDNEYLSHTWKCLRECSAPLTIFGSGLGEQDQHLIDAINEHPDRPVAVSLHRPSGPATRNKIRARQAEIRARLDAEPLFFFNSATHPLGQPRAHEERDAVASANQAKPSRRVASSLQRVPLDSRIAHYVRGSPSPRHARLAPKLIERMARRLLMRTGRFAAQTEPDDLVRRDGRRRSVQWTFTVLSSSGSGSIGRRVDAFGTRGPAGVPTAPERSDCGHHAAYPGAGESWGVQDFWLETRSHRHLKIAVPRMRGLSGDELARLGRLERSTAYGGVRSEDERSESMREPGFDESPSRDVDLVPRGEVVCARRHLADDLLDREQRRVVVEEQVEDAAGRVAHNITGQRYSK